MTKNKGKSFEQFDIVVKLQKNKEKVLTHCPKHGKLYYENKAEHDSVLTGSHWVQQGQYFDYLPLDCG